MTVNIVVPEMGESVVDARVARWLKKEGEAVTVGEPLVELETDKVDVEVNAPRNGVLETIAQAEGADVKIGDVLGTVAEGAAAAAPAAAASAPVAPAASERGAGASAGGTSAGGASAAPVAATPSARRAARAQDVPIGEVKAEGPRVTKADVERAAAVTPLSRPFAALSDAVKHAAAPAPAPAPPAQGAPTAVAPIAPAVAGERREERVRMSKRRATIAKRLVEAQHTAAMLTTFNEVDMSAVMALRERHKESFKTKHGFALGIVSFFVKASIAALREFPRLNAEIRGDEMVLKHYYDVGVAVGAAEGLVVPVLRDADRLSFAAVEGKIREFAKKAGDGTLTLDDLRGGTFSITNGGVFGSLMSTPILNPPQVGILGLHAIKDRPAAVNGQIAIRPMMYLALTYDHRIVDGSEAVRFLVRVKDLIEDPAALVIEG
ncbi:MAG: 2-oxoglutarate dehydrogenase complex dihydrolipoyllysine-residue succinyltransferase [Acidobacteria bacterium]|nr:2-oxoglutarate dehydrogenase complex dihydrolipoyllysine-residue succinyltransferase [Acidobacteriota bacterium]